ncbi:MAG: tetratricopeptide repeat protein [Saprospiraceae bacterium]|nr:tetratricopeptide repeat protein [Saprospiraceae bacterium]
MGMSYKSKYRIAVQRWMLPCLILLLLAGVGKTQSDDRLSTATGTDRVDLFYQIAKEHIYDSLPLSLEYATLGLELAEKLDYTQGRADCLTMLAIANELEGELAIGIKLYEEAYVLYHQAGAVEYAVGCIINMGISNYLAGDYGQALQYYNRALEEAKMRGLEATESKILNNIGAIQRHLKDYEMAVKTYENSLQLKKQLGDSLGYALTLENLGLAYSYLEMPAKSIDYIEQAIYRFQEANRSREAAQAKLSLATAYNSLGLVEDAQTVLTTIIRQHFDDYTPLMRSQTYLELARVYQSEKEYELWEQTLDPGYRIIQDSENQDLKLDYLKQYIDLFHETQRYDLAFSFQEEYITTLQVLNQWDRMKLEKEMKAKFELADKEAQLENQEMVLRQRQRERNWYLALSLIALLLLIGAVRYLQLKNQSNRQLQDQKKVIETSLREKEMLLREVHHRVKNNLQVVSSLLSLQARSLRGAEAVEALEDGKNRVRSMALIHQNLYQEEHLSGVDTSSYMDRLCESLMRTYSIDDSEVTLRTEIDPILLDIDSVIPLGLIINELITNALKYAFPEKSGGEIFVKLSQEEGALNLMVKDNGVGMTVPQIDSLNSLGFKLIKAFSAKLKGSLSIYNREGTEVHCRFSNYKVVPA